MTIRLVSLRDEARVSGEAAATAHFLRTVEGLGVAVEPTAETTGQGGRAFDSGRRLLRLRSVARQSAASHLIVKVPTAAQVPLVCRAARGHARNLILWVDGLLWRPDLSLRQTLLLARHEPALLAARALTNSSPWTLAARRTRVSLVVSSRTQRDELTAVMPWATTHVIPNGTRALARRDGGAPRPFTAGYLGHAYLTKGVREMASAARAAEVPLRWAFSGLGNPRFVDEARRAGVEVLGEVDVEEFFASIDLLVAPFWTSWGTQAFPSILLEAMQLGVPVLTSDLPLLRELFPEDLALFVPPGDGAALAAKLASAARGTTALPSPARLRQHFAAHYADAHIAAAWRTALGLGDGAATRGAG